MPDRELARKAVQLVLGEHLGDEAELAEHRQPARLGHGDPRGLLAAVLQRVQAEVGEPRDVTLGRPDAEDAAHQTVPSSTRSDQSSAVPAAYATTTPRSSLQHSVT